jgi:predicted nucleotidyltransferase
LSSVHIHDKDLALVHKILGAHLPVYAQVWVFGSRATAKTKRASDLDLAVDAGRPLTRQEHAGLLEAFDESVLAYRVDIVDMQTASARFRSVINQHKIALDGWAAKPEV